MLALSALDAEGRYRGYAYVGQDRVIEMVGVIGAGVWGDSQRTWWPGTYEARMLSMLSSTIRPLLDQLNQGRTAYLFMTVADIEDTAIVTDFEGVERPFALPRGMRAVELEPVRLDDSPSSRSMLVASFNKVREAVGLRNAIPFYLKDPC
ncbi:hypothetical protein [Caballeronia sp. GAFFF1]|uniref:hypothetical protein n=1 Tax=Caballeronia sp. GAFFF1 TaxID=2921779 RepID=UPI00202796EC|nr:hypothetical protein [Caballeronia sp. GAFFF1]